MKEKVNSPMRVGIIFPYWNEKLGGPYSILYKILSEKVFGDAKVTVFLIGQKDQVSQKAKDFFSNLEIKVCYPHASRDNIYGIINIRSWIGLISSLSKQNLVVVNYFYTLNLIYALISKSLNSRQQLVVIPHGSLTEYQEQIRKIRKWLFKIIFVYPNRGKLNRIVTFHTSELESLPKKLQSRGEIARIPQSPIVCQENDNLTIDPKTFVFVGRIHSTKRLDIAIQAISFLKDRGEKVKLLIIGDGEKEEREKLVKLADSLRVADQITFLGWLFGEEKNKILKDKAALVLPSDNESFGLVISEAMEMGLPCIVSSGVAVKNEVLESGKGLVFDKGDPLSLANCIDIFLRTQRWQRRIVSTKLLDDREVNKYDYRSWVYESGI